MASAATLMQVVVKNTFLEVVSSDGPPPHRLSQSQSEKTLRASYEGPFSSPAGGAIASEVMSPFVARSGCKSPWSGASTCAGEDGEDGGDGSPAASSVPSSAASASTGSGAEEEDSSCKTRARTRSTAVARGQDSAASFHLHGINKTGDKTRAWLRLHAAGRCKPCFAATRTAGCPKGKGCRFCHEPGHEAKEGRRPNKAAREACRQAAQMLEAGDPSAAVLAEELLHRHGEYMAIILRVARDRSRAACTGDVALPLPQ